MAQSAISNPYGPLFSSGLDQILVWAGVGVAAACAGWVIAKVRNNTEGAFPNALRTLVIISASPSAVFIPGLLGILLKADSVLWIFWQLLFLLATIAVFWVFPCLLLGVLVWGLIGKLLHLQEWRGAKILALATAFEAFNAGIYFVLVAAAAKDA